ncbi:MAG: sensor histidine kinase [Gemmatimonas sp.]|nr:histidine kinase [Gemmatimonadaceae bacterium]
MSARAQFWVLQALGWGAFVGALLFPWLGALPLEGMLLAKAPLIAAGVAVTLLLRMLYRALLKAGARGWVLAAAIGAASYTAAVLWSVTADWTSRALLHGAEHVSLIRLSFDRFGGTWYCALVLLAWSLLYFGVTQYRALLAERERSVRSESLAREARLDALRYQINPHFLFNTLNAISTLIVEVRPREASEMISRLSDFLRLTLSGNAEAEISLAEEVSFVRQYLEIERVRFGERLSIDIDIDPEVEALSVPALILLPIVENAVHHAVERNEYGGRVAVRAALRDRELQLLVSDDGPGEEQIASAGSGIGLSNTRARLQQLFGAAGQLRWRALPSGGSEYVLAMPLRATVPAHAHFALA